MPSTPRTSGFTNKRLSCIAFAVCFAGLGCGDNRPLSEHALPQCDDDGNLPGFSAANYDQSCDTDADCVAVSDLALCSPCRLACTNTAINHSAESQYRADLADLGVTQDTSVACFCPAEFSPCCIDNQCRADLQCGISR
jgi:hypothetical protein